MERALQLMMVSGAMACSLPPIESQDSQCLDGEITRVATGETFDSLAEAITMAHTADHLCLGAGEYALDSVAIQRIESSLYSQELTIEGAGRSETILRATDGFDTLLYIEMSGALNVEGLTISGGRARLKADDVTVRDVAFSDYQGWERGFTIKGETVEVSDLDVGGNQMDYASGLYVSADELGVVERLSVYDNHSAAGYLVEFHGNMELHDSQITSNELTMEQPGYDLLEFFGPAVVDNVTFTHNTFNGPALRAYDSLDARNLVITDNSTIYAAVLTLMGHSILEDAQIYGNSGRDGAIGLYSDASVVIEGINSGLDHPVNEPCDLYGDPCDETVEGTCVPQCLDVELSGSLQCDAWGCGAR